jgi:hypothetical protein
MIAKARRDPLNPGRHHFAVALRHAGRLETRKHRRKVLEIDENSLPEHARRGLRSAGASTSARADQRAHAAMPWRTWSSDNWQRMVEADDGAPRPAATARSRRRARCANRARSVPRCRVSIGPSIGPSARSKSDIRRWSRSCGRSSSSGGPPGETDESPAS